MWWTRQNTPIRLLVLLYYIATHQSNILPTSDVPLSTGGGLNNNFPMSEFHNEMLTLKQSKQLSIHSPGSILDVCVAFFYCLCKKMTAV